MGSALHFIAAEGHVQAQFYNRSNISLCDHFGRLGQACRALLARSDFGQANSRSA